ncbi:MAG: 2-hydroxyacid dehydrogenase [Sedimentisphaerales bacterium]|nr:2-hydroxyacid dehydrogenase [Sedimentisphaerales bacterium]
MSESVSIAFFDTKPYDREFFDAINADGYSYNFRYFENRLKIETVPLADGCRIVCAFVNDRLSTDVINKLKSLNVELIALRCAGYNNVDLRAAYRMMRVVRVPEYSPYAVAEHAVALILSLNRKTHKAYYRTRDGNFSIGGFMGFDMAGKTAGIIGTGKIGKIAAKILRGFDMWVLVYDPYPDQEFAKTTKVEYVDLEELYVKSDVISLHCPLTHDTYHIIDEESLGKMKDGVMIVNTGRGGLINAKALIDALKSGKVGAAGLDVYEEESEYFFEDFSTQVLDDDVLARLLTFSNVLITSHQGFFTREAMQNIARTTLENIRDFLDGKPLKNEICYRCGQDVCKKKETGRCF